MTGLLHFRRTCNQVSFLFEWHISQLELGYLVGQKGVCGYCPYIVLF